MSEHDDDPVFEAACQLIAGSIARAMPGMIAVAVAGSPQLAGHESCVEGTVLRSLLGLTVERAAARAAIATGRPEPECRARILASEVEALAAALGVGFRAVPVAVAADEAEAPAPTAH